MTKLTELCANCGKDYGQHSVKDACPTSKAKQTRFGWSRYSTVLKFRAAGKGE